MVGVGALDDPQKTKELRLKRQEETHKSMAKVSLGMHWAKMMALFTGCRGASPYHELPAPTARRPTTTDCPCGQPYHNERRALSKHLRSKYITVRGARIITLIRVVGSPAPTVRRDAYPPCSDHGAQGVFFANFGSLRPGIIFYRKDLISLK